MSPCRVRFALSQLSETTRCFLPWLPSALSTGACCQLAKSATKNRTPACARSFPWLSLGQGNDCQHVSTEPSLLLAKSK